MGRSASTAARVVLALFDLVTLLLGVALLGLALYLYFAQHFSQLSATDKRLPGVLFGLMAAGAVMALVSTMGLIGALCRSHCALCLYAVLSCAIVALQCVAVLFVFVFKSNVKLFIERALNELLSAYKTSKPDMGTALDFVQSLCRCCGVTGFIDFMPTVSLPSSCCPNAPSSNAIVCSVAMLQGNVPGCKQRFLDVLYGPVMPITLGSFAGLLLLELFLIAMASYLCNRIRRERR